MDGGLGAVSFGVIFSSINAVFKFAEIVAKLQDVPDEARRFSTLITIVRGDLYEALRVSTDPAVQARFNTDPHDKSYVLSTIENVHASLQSIGEFVEKIRVKDQDGKGSVSLKRRAEWLWKHKSQVASSERVLDASHKSMLGAMQRMMAWIDMSSMTGVVGVVSNPGPPSYQNVVKNVGDESDDNLIATRRRMARYYGRDRSKSQISVSEVPATAWSAETLNTLDEVPTMSARTYGPVDTNYVAVPSHEGAFATAFNPTHPRPPSGRQTDFQMPHSEPCLSNTSSRPHSDWGLETLSHLRTVQLARTSISGTASAVGGGEEIPTFPPARIERFSFDERRLPESNVRGDWVRGAMERHAHRPLSAMSSRRDLRRASMRLASGGYDDVR